MKKIDTSWKEITFPYSIPFFDIDPEPSGKRLGRAGFQLCMKGIQFWLNRRQQPKSWEEDRWHGFFRKGTCFSISSPSNSSHPHNVWMVGWCKEHMTASICIYVPDGTSILELDSWGLSFR